MRLPKPAEWTGLATLILGGLVYMKANKKVVGILLILAGIGFFVVSFVSSDDRGRSLDHHNQRAATSGTNSTVIQAAPGANVVSVGSDNKGITIIGSIGQQGGQTFLNITVTNSTGTSEPKLTGVYTVKNAPSGGKYVTNAKLHIDSPRAITLTIAAFGTNIESVTLFREGSSVAGGFVRGAGEGFSSCTMENAYGNLDLIILSATPQEFRLVAQIR